MQLTENRNFDRWRQPPIMVAIGDKSFKTADWSLGGVLLESVEELGWKCGQAVDVKLGLRTPRMYTDNMIVVRYSAEEKRLALRARHSASILTQVRQDCHVAGIEPV